MRTTKASRILPLGLFAYQTMLLAGTTGSVSGTIKDASGGVIIGVSLSVTNPATGIQNKTVTDTKGFYSFPSPPVGRYDLKAEIQGFRAQDRKGLTIDADSALQIDLIMAVAEKVEEVTVTESAGEVELETVSTQMGDVVTGAKMASVALNGRSYTDLLALQPGIVPMSTQTPDSIVMAGASVAIAPSGGLNPGNQSISGQREDANGFVVNGGDAKELMNGGTSIVPNLDSIAEFRVLTNNFDAEYGNYSGGIVNVVTKSGDNRCMEARSSSRETLTSTQETSFPRIGVSTVRTSSAARWAAQSGVTRSSSSETTRVRGRTRESTPGLFPSPRLPSGQAI